MFRGLTLALVATVVFSGTVLAGGNSGGTKKDATFRVTNDKPFAYICIIDASDSLKSKLAAGTATIEDLNREGGKILQPGKIGNYKVKAGTHRIGIAVIDSAGDIGTPSEHVRSVSKGKTLDVYISNLVNESS